MTDPVDTDALRVVAHAADQDPLYRWAGDAFRAAADEVDPLRAVIENAPNGDGCGHVNWDTDGLLRVGKCTCWKADAL